MRISYGWVATTNANEIKALTRIEREKYSVTRLLVNLFEKPVQLHFLLASSQTHLAFKPDSTLSGKALDQC